MRPAPPFSKSQSRKKLKPEAIVEPDKPKHKEKKKLPIANQRQVHLPPPRIGRISERPSVYLRGIDLRRNRAENKIELYTNFSPNSFKVEIMLNELELDHNAYYVDVMKGEHLKADFLKLNPTYQVPVLVDMRGEENITI